MTRMASLKSYQDLAEWRRTQRLGRKRIAKANSDPVAWVAFLEETLRPLSPPIASAPRATDDSSTDPPKNPCLSPAFLFPTDADPERERPARQRPGYSFLDFPPEIRHMIYHYAVDYPSCRSLFSAYYLQRRDGFEIRHHTPTVLLLCKEVTREALTVLRTRPFVIDRIPPWLYGHRQPLPITWFISRETLQNIRLFEFKVTLGEGSCGSTNIWHRVLRYVFELWAERNSVARLRVMFKLCNLDFDDMWRCWELEEYEKLVDRVRPSRPRDIERARDPLSCNSS